MKQINYSKYGNSDVLKLTDVPKPTLKKKKSLLIKVEYSSLNAIDWKNRKGDFRIFSGWFKPRTKQGFDVVGTVVSKSEDVLDFQLYDKVVALLGNFSGGALSEYICLSPDEVVKIPNGLDQRQVAGIPMAGITAWQALLQDAKLKEDNKVLINGGSSGVGHLAIQIAKAYGAHVTTVSSANNMDFCKELGADVTINYEDHDFRELNEQFDIVFDVVFNASLKQVKPILKPNGIYVGTTPSLELIKDIVFTKQAKFVAVGPNLKALQDLIRLMQKGDLRVAIDKTFLAENIVAAHDYMQKSRTRGKLIVKV